MKNLKLVYWLILVAVIFGTGFYFGGQNNGFSKNIKSNDSKIKKVDLDNFLDLWKKIDEKFVDTREDQSKEITQEEHLWGAMKGLTASYGDLYTSFLSPEETKSLKADISGEFSGIGAEIVNRNGYLTVVSPLPDTPAFRAGLKAKDIIMEIDGADSINMFSEEAVDLIRGKKGTKVKLKIARKGESKPLEIEITRDTINVPIVKTFQKKDVFVIKVYSFTENSPEKFLEAIKKFIRTKKKKLIIDVRGNPGGHLFAVTYILGLFLDPGKIILTEDHGGPSKDGKENNILRSGDYHKDKNLVNIFNDNLELAVLMDGGSASAAEILAGVLMNHRKAILLGENSFGKGTVQELVPLKDNTALKVTIAKWILPNGSWISHKGISPDVEIGISDEETKKILEHGSFSNDIDAQMNKAIEYLSKYKTKDSFRKALDDFYTKRLNRKKEERDSKIKEAVGIIEDIEK